MANCFSIKYLEIRIKTTNSLIYKAQLKYGHSAFRLDIIEYCNSSILKKRAQCYMDHLEHKYNILEFAHTLLGYKHTHEASDKMKQKAANRIHKPNPGIEVEITDQNTGISTCYDSIREAANFMRSKHSSLLKRQRIILNKRGLNYSPFIFKGRYVVNIKREDGAVED